MCSPCHGSASPTVTSSSSNRLRSHAQPVPAFPCSSGVQAWPTGNPHKSTCGSFHVVTLQEAGLSPVEPRPGSDTDPFHTYTDNNDLSDTFEPGAVSVPIESSTSKDTWGLEALVVRVADSPTWTSCSVHIHNKVAKTRDASTVLLRLVPITPYGTTRC